MDIRTKLFGRFAKAPRQTCTWLVETTVRKLVVEDHISEVARMGWGGWWGGIFC